MGSDGRTAAEVRGDIARERDQLADAVDELRKGMGEVTNVKGQLQAKLPAVTAAALGTGFFLAGGIGATMRYLARRSRERR